MSTKSINFNVNNIFLNMYEHGFIHVTDHYRPQRSWGKVIFLHVSVILFTRRFCLSACSDTPPRSRCPPPGTDTHPWEQTPPGADTCPEKTPPPLREQCMLGDTGNKRAVRILLECILVEYGFYLGKSVPGIDGLFDGVSLLHHLSTSGHHAGNQSLKI